MLSHFSSAKIGELISNDYFCGKQYNSNNYGGKTYIKKHSILSYASFK